MPSQAPGETERFVDHGESPDEPVQAEPAERVTWLLATPSWALSALLHLILILFLIGMVTRQPVSRPPDIGGPISPIPTRVPLEKRPVYDSLAKRIPDRGRRLPRLPDTKVAVEKERLAELREVEPGEMAWDMPKGTGFESATNAQIADNVPTPFTSDAMGVGDGAAAAWGARTGEGRAKATEKVPEHVEDVVRAALEWLLRHQSLDGSWQAAGFTERCAKACRNVSAERYGDGRGSTEHDVGVTALAMLAFTGDGHTHRHSESPEYAECLRKAADYLLKVQVHSNDPATDGCYGEARGEQWIYDHAIATMAMAELLLLSGDVIRLKKSVSDATKLCLRAQNDGRGWRYGIRPGDNDTSVTGWMVLALKTARVARLDISREEFDRAFKGAMTWVNYATDARGRTGYLSPGDSGSMLAALARDGAYPYSKEPSCMTAVGVLCRTFSGESRTSLPVRGGVKILMQALPRWQESQGGSLSTVNMYYWYYGSYALFQYGGEEWKRWNKAMVDTLLARQRQGNICEDGSWDPIDEWGSVGGRVYATALGAMTFEVYYRFCRLDGTPDGEGAGGKKV